MLPQSQPRKKKNSSRVNLIISFVFHAVLVGALLYFAARNGLLGTQIKKLTVTVVKEPPKPKEPDKPKTEPPKVVTPKFEAPKMEEAKQAPPPTASPVSAPPAVDIPSFAFDGGKAVNEVSDPVQQYKGYMQYVLETKWNRPDNMDDEKWAALVQVNVDKAGNLSGVVFQQGSGNNKWDQSVKDVFKTVQNIGHKPPTNFPSQVTVKFDVQSEETEPVMMQ